MPDPIFVDAEGPSEFVDAPAPTRAQGQPKPKKGYTAKSSDDEIITAMGYDPAVIKKAKGYIPGMFQAFTTDPGSATSKATSGPLFAGLKGVANTALGAMQLLSRVSQKMPFTGRAVSDADVQLIDLAKKFMDTEYTRSHRQLGNETVRPDSLASKALGASEFLGEAAPTLALPGSSLGGAKVFSRAGAKALGKTALMGAGTAALQPVDVEKPDALDYWGKKFGQVGSAAVSAPLFQVGLEKGAIPLVEKTLRGTKLGDRLGISRTKPDKYTLNPKYEGAPELSAELDKAGITHTVGDITSDPKVLSYEAAMARKDPRMMDLRVKQNQEATAYADKMVADLNKAAKDEGWRGVEDLTRAAESGGKRANEARKLLTVLENSGDDTKKAVQASGNLELLTRKLKADQLYDKAERIAANVGSVKPHGFVTNLEESIRQIKSNPANDQSMVGYLQGILDDVKASGTVPFGKLRETRTILNRKISGLTDPKAAVQDVDAARSALQSVVKGLESDMDGFAKNSTPELAKAWKEATDFYRESVVPFKDKGIAKILTSEDPQAMANLFKGKNPYEQKRMFDLLEPKGQKALAASLIEDAVAAGQKTQRGAMAPTMSAASVASALEKLDANKTMGIVFKGEDKMAVKGMARLLRSIDRSDTIAWIPPTGESLERLGSTAMHGQLTALGVGEKAMGWLNKERLFRLYTDPKGKALLVKASSATPGSRMMDSLMKQAAKIVGTSQAEETKQQEQ